MEWIRSHTYASALAAASIVVILGCIFVASRPTTTATGGVSAWSGNPGVLGPTTTEPQTVTTHNGASVLADQNYGTQTLPYTQNTTATTSQGTTQTSDGNTYDFNALLAKLSNSSRNKSGTTTTTQQTSNAWDFIPSGLISVQNATPERTPLQQSLYQYGNAVGSLITGYDSAHSDQAQILSNATKDRQNSTKAAAVERIGQDLQAVGQGIADLSNVPTAMQADNTALSKSYVDIGTKLIAVAKAFPQQDPDLVAAIKTYDSSVQSFNTSYIAIANMFSSYGVTFSSGDPGSVFSFSSSSL